MNDRLYVDIHVIETLPPSCVNRDDLGSPKTAFYGGVTRARVSSQAWKHIIRKEFENMSEDVGKRTKHILNPEMAMVIGSGMDALGEKVSLSAMLDKLEEHLTEALSEEESK